MKIQDRLTKIDVMMEPSVTDEHMQANYPRSRFVASAQTSATIDAYSVSLHARAASTVSRPRAGHGRSYEENCHVSLHSIDLEERPVRTRHISSGLGRPRGQDSPLKVQE